MTRPSVWRPDRAAIGAVCLIAALAIPGAVAAQQSLDARTVADLLDVCAPQGALQGDPVATLTSRIWLPPITDQDRERVQNHLTLFAVAENLDLMPQTTPARELARLKAESLAGLDAHIVLTNAKVPPYLAVLTLDWSRASRDSIQRRCRVSTGAAPAYADLFQKIATTAQASDETLYAETPFVAAAGPVTLGTSPAVTALAWKLDAAAFKADVGTPPDTTLFFELTTITGIHAN